MLRSHGDGDMHTVAAPVLDEEDRVHVGLNLSHFTGGHCAELAALALAPERPVPPSRSAAVFCRRADGTGRC